MNTPSDTPTTPPLITQPTVSKLEIKKGKLKAAGIHFLVSLAIFSILIAISIFVRYPGYLFLLEGTFFGIAIAASVDLILGPLLTFIIYNSLKKRSELVGDIALIGLIQLAAFAYGAWHINNERPVALVHYIDSFYTVHYKNAVQSNSLNRLYDDSNTYFNGIPLFTYSQPITEKDKKHQLDIVTTLQIPEYEQIDFYTHLTKNNILERTVLKQKIPAHHRLDNYRDPHFFWKLMIAKKGKAILVFTRHNLKAVDLIELPNK
jgi:hypothetical protein